MIAQLGGQEFLEASVRTSKGLSSTNHSLLRHPVVHCFGSSGVHIERVPHTRCRRIGGWCHYYESRKVFSRTGGGSVHGFRTSVNEIWRALKDLTFPTLDPLIAWSSIGAYSDVLRGRVDDMYKHVIQREHPLARIWEKSPLIARISQSEA